MALASLDLKQLRKGEGIVFLQQVRHCITFFLLIFLFNNLNHFVRQA